MPSIFSAGLMAAFTLLTTTTLVSAISLRTDQTTPDTNLAVYYGQGYNQSRLGEYCNDDTVDIFPIAFVTGLPDQTDDGFPVLNFGNSRCDVWVDPATGKHTGMFTDCQDLIEDIGLCQRKGKKILLSIGGASYLKITSQESAKDLAKYLWQAFGTPGQAGYSGARPFGSITIDGFDFDIENAPDTDQTLWGTLASELRSNAAASGDQIILSAAPQCVVPDLDSGAGDIMGPAIHMASFDYVWIQFYNTPFCSAKAHFDHNYGQPGSDISFDEWMNWLQSNSYNKNVKAFIGLPASPTALAESAMYLLPFQLRDLIKEFGTKYTASFGGVMLWEATKSDENQIGTGSYAQLVRELFKVIWPPVISFTSSSSTTYSTISSTIPTTTSSVATTDAATTSSVSTAPATTTTVAGLASNTTVLTTGTPLNTLSNTTSICNGTISTASFNTSGSLYTATPAPPYQNTTRTSPIFTTPLSASTIATNIHSINRTVLHHSTSHRAISTATPSNSVSAPVVSNEWTPWPSIDSSSSTTIALSQSFNAYTPSASSTVSQTKFTTSISVQTPSNPSRVSLDTIITVITTFYTSVCPTGYTIIPVTSTLTITIDQIPVQTKPASRSTTTSNSTSLKTFVTALADVTIKRNSYSDPSPSPWPSTYLSWSFKSSTPSSTSSKHPKSSSAPGTGPESIHGSNGVGILTGGASSSTEWNGSVTMVVWGFMSWIGAGIFGGLL